MGWTDERVEQLKQLWTEGLSASQIARQLGGVTRNAVIGKVHRLGLQQRRPSPKSKEEVVHYLRLDRLGAGMCSWPIGEPGSADFHFCGEASMAGKPYCAHHCAIAYVKVKEPRTADGSAA